MRAAPLAALLLIGAASAAVAQTRTLAQAGGWTAFGGTLDSGVSTCGVDTREAQSGRHFLLQFVGSDSQRLAARALRPSWAIPAGTSIRVRLTIDGQPGWEATATGNGREVQWFIGMNTLDRFESLFRQGASMRLDFIGGSEPAWTFNLTGTNAIMGRFVDCLRAIRGGGQGPTQPYVDRGPTQPFGGSPAPAQPFGTTSRPAGTYEGAPKSGTR